MNNNSDRYDYFCVVVAKQQMDPNGNRTTLSQWLQRANTVRMKAVN